MQDDQTRDGTCAPGTEPGGATAVDGPSWPPARVAWLWVSVCVLAYICAYIDRQILSLMVDKVKSGLQITDSQFGLLHGLSFAMLYATLGLFVGGLVDRFPRRTIIICGILLWSMMTAVCGMTRSFFQLFLARAGVGIGEATLTPSAYSLLADCFPKERLGRALSVYFAGAGLGTGIAFIAGGMLIAAVDKVAPTTLPLLGEMQTWQIVFLIVALPGFPIALLLYALTEPQRQGRTRAVAPPWSAVWAFLKSRWRFMLPFFIAISGAATVSLAGLAWTPAYWMRTQGQTASEAGLLLGVVAMTAIPIGLMVGAWASEFLERRGVRGGALLVSGGSALLVCVPATSLAFITDPTWSIIAVTLAMFFTNMPFGIVAATLQTATPNAMRGRISAMSLLAQNACGMIIGPLIPGLLTDQLFGGDGQMVAVSLSITLVGAAALTAVFFLISFINRREIGAEVEAEA